MVEQTSRNNNDARLQQELTKLAHLDRTGRVTKSDVAMYAHGGFCDVYVGTIDRKELDPMLTIEQSGNEVKIAIKRLRAHIYHDRDFLKPFVEELRVWSRLRHPNILPLFGYLMEGNYPSILSEWMENGTARRYVLDHELSVTELLTMFLGISQGVKYLHDNYIIHSDIKAENILINQSKMPLICDFGVSRMLNSSLTSRGTTGLGRGTIRWMAPELLTYIPSPGSDSVSHTRETDIWALGMTFYELISKGPPFAETRMDAQVISIVLNLGVPHFPANLSEWGVSLDCIWNICLSCWHFCKEDRLRIDEVIQAMTTCQEIVTATESQVQTISEHINQTLLDGMESRSSHLARHSSARYSVDSRRFSGSSVLLSESDSHRRRRLQLPQLNVEVGYSSYERAEETIHITRSPDSIPPFDDVPVPPLRFRNKEQNRNNNALLMPTTNCEPSSAGSQKSDGPRGNVTPIHAPPYELITSSRDQEAKDTIQSWLSTIPKPSPISASPRPFRPLPPLPVGAPKEIRPTPRVSTPPSASTSREAKPHHSPKSSLSLDASPKFKWVRGELLAKASYGRVYLALNVSTGEMMVVKQIKAPQNNSDMDPQSQSLLNDVLENEIDKIRDINHTNIVRYLGLERTPNYMSIFFSYAADGSISECVKKHGRFHDQVVRSFTAQVLNALEYLHSIGIFHKNLKGDKVLVNHSGVCKVSLFGLSERIQELDIKVNIATTGSLHWTAPEIIQAKQRNEQYTCTDRTDIWGVGCIAYEMWTGHRPWQLLGEVAISQMLMDSKVPLIPPNVKLGLEADDFRTKCFLPKPNRRPSAAKLRQHPYLMLEPGWTFTDFV